MIDVKDEILASEPLFRIIDKNGNILFDELKIEMVTKVLQESTPLNKVLFDSIKNDIDSRLLTSNKATTEQANAGTDDTTYMTPLKTMQVLENGCKVFENNIDITKSNQNYNINVDNYVTTNTLFVEITAYIQNAGSIRWNLKEDSYIRGISIQTEGNSEIIESQNLYLNDGYSDVRMKIIADVKNGFACVFLCDYKDNGSSGYFDKIIFSKFANGTFGTLQFTTNGFSNASSAFEIKEYRKI